MTPPPPPSRRAGPTTVVVTGLGAVSAWGWGCDALWRGLCSGRTAIGPLDRFPAEEQRTTVAAQVPDAPPAVAAGFRGTTAGDSVGPGGWDDLALSDRYALAATRVAWEQAGLEPIDPTAEDAPVVGVFFGGSTAGMFESEEFFARPDPSGPAARLLPTQPINAPADAVARFLGATGPVLTVSSACASGTQALGAALDALRAGEVDVAVAGGADSLCRLTYAGFNALRVVDAEPCRPFRAGRAGMSLGEGAGILIFETEERARSRGARVLARLAGVGNSCDAHHMTAPHPEGAGARLAVARAFEDAGTDPADLAFVNAHGTGTPMNDTSEWRGLAAVLGDEAARTVPLTATKASVGHLLGSSGAVEAVATVLCFEHGQVHPTPPTGAADGASPAEAEDGRGADEIDPDAPAHLVLAAPLPLPDGRAAISTSFGFGGANAAVVFHRGNVHRDDAAPSTDTPTHER